MKKIYTGIILCLLFFAASAQNNEHIIKIAGTRLTYGLFQQWIDAYTKTNPGAHLVIDGKTPADSADILIVSHILTAADVKPGKTAIAVTRYAELPVVNRKRSDVNELQSKGFTEAIFRQVYFSDSNSAAGYHFAVYKREKPACSSIAFANHFGNGVKDLKGIGVPGDDRDLLNAVKNDSNAISYNNLGFIYDIQTRKVTDGISIVPIDLNENGRIDEDENIYGTLDDVIHFIEKTKNAKIPADYVHVIFRKDNPDKEVIAFLKWILKNGGQYNHAFGFIDMEPQQVHEELEKLN